MKNSSNFSPSIGAPTPIQVSSEPYPQAVENPTANRVLAELEQNGVVVLPALFTKNQIDNMRKAFEVRLHGVRWNDLDGYEREALRHAIQDVLTVEQGFVDLAIHPLVMEILAKYIGPDFALTEAKGWKSLPTTRDFQGWHGDYWYDETKVTGICKEVKLAMYLTDVTTGAFNYIKGSHQQQHPRLVQNSEVENVPRSNILEIVGPAGTAFLFDSSGIHRQGVPILDPRQAIFYNYHDPNVPLAQEAVDYYRYHPLLLNAAFLGDLSQEAQRILGFGNKTRYMPAFRRTTQHNLLYRTFSLAFGATIKIDDLRERGTQRLKRLLKFKV